jgi:sugar phosphate permease
VNKKTRILLLGSNLWIFADGMLGPLFAVFTERVGGNILDLTWAWAIYLGITGVGVMIVGKQSDKMNKGKERLLVIGYGLTALFTLSYLFVSSTFDLFLVQAGLGVALAMANPTWYALYDKHAPKKNNGQTWGMADGQGKLFTAVAILIGGFIVQQFSFEALFLSMGLIQVLATVYMAKVLK